MKGSKLFGFIFLSCFVQIFSQAKNFDMDTLEKDKILSCNELVSKRFLLDQKIIEDIASAYGQFKDNAKVKISGDMLSLCYNKINDDTVRSIFNNLTFYDFDFNEELNNLVKVDYSKYKDLTDMSIPREQETLFMKVDQVKPEYINTNRQRQELAAKSFPQIFGFDIMSVSPAFKLLYTLIIFALIALGIFYALGKVQNKKKEERKKKKKNK